MNWLEALQPAPDQRWAAQEAAFEAFKAQHTTAEVKAMSDGDFNAWLDEYDRLHDALYAAQMACDHAY